MWLVAVARQGLAMAALRTGAGTTCMSPPSYGPGEGDRALNLMLASWCPGGACPIDDS